MIKQFPSCTQAIFPLLRLHTESVAFPLHQILTPESLHLETIHNSEKVSR
jgi:hypothetical protein